MPKQSGLKDPRDTQRSEQTRVWQLLRAGLIFLLLAVGMTLGLILFDTFDPKPSGDLLYTTWPGQYTLAGGEERFFPLEAGDEFSSISQEYTLRLTATYRDGETDSGFGLMVGDVDHRFVVALSPLGYVSVWESEDDSTSTMHLPWQTWPHVKPGTIPNEISFDVKPTITGSKITARINRELLWQGEMETIKPAAGLWVASFGGPVTVDFNSLEWFAEGLPDRY